MIILFKRKKMYNFFGVLNLCTVFLLIYWLYKSKKILSNDNLIKLKHRGKKINCSEHSILCFNTGHCLTSCEDLTYSCINGICRLKDDQQVLSINCKNGGTPYITDERLETCLCPYPDYFTGDDCSKKNELVCQGGLLDFNKFPYPALMCTCLNQNELVILNQLPYCVPKQSYWWFKKFETIKD
jgi:hypothetical protein